jgi:hypothetical protein
MFVPLAAISLFAIQAQRHYMPTALMLIAVGLLSAIFGFLQAVGGDGLHLYQVTHRGYPVGLFANKNHQSVLLLNLMLGVSWLATKADARLVSSGFVISGALSLILVLFPLLILTGSRAGLLLSVPTLALCLWLLFRAPAMECVVQRARGRAKLVIGCLAGLVLTPLLLVFGVLAFSDRRTALSRLFELDAADDLRWSYLPLLPRMMVDHLPLGSGFGSFERVFNTYEPAEMLISRYMNHAHNDLMQLLIEGGLPALLLLLIACGWLFYALWRVWRQGSGGQLAAAFYGGSIALWLSASLVDYPLRTPLGAMLVAALTAQLSYLSKRVRMDRGIPGRQSARTRAS